MKEFFSHERATGLFIILFAAFIYFVLIPIGIVTPSNIEHRSTAPDFWPLIITGIIAFMGLLLMVSKPAVIDPDDSSDEQAQTFIQRLPRLAIILGVLFAFYFLIPHFGMVVPAMVLIFTLMFVAGQRRWFLMLLLSISVPLMLYGFFVHVANIPIPLGLFEVLRG